MDKFEDHVLVNIIKNLNLNERVPVRMVSKKFRNLCDNIAIEKLFVFERKSVLPYELKLITDEFNMVDTVNVYDIRKFFSMKILKQMKSIKKLAIKGIFDYNLNNYLK